MEAGHADGDGDGLLRHPNSRVDGLTLRRARARVGIARCGFVVRDSRDGLFADEDADETTLARESPTAGASVSRVHPWVKPEVNDAVMATLDPLRTRPATRPAPWPG